MPNEQWDDFALSREFESLNKRLEMYEHALEGLSHFPIDVAKATLNVEHLAEEIGTIRGDIAQVAHTCEGFHKEWKEATEAKGKGRTAIMVAVITGCFTVLAALVVLVASLAGA